MHHIVVDSVDGGRPAAEEGVVRGDYVLGIIGWDQSKAPTLQQIQAALASNPGNVRFSC